MFIKQNQVDIMMMKTIVFKYLQTIHITAAIFLVHIKHNTTHIFFPIVVVVVFFFTQNKNPFVSPERFHSIHSFETSLQ